ncbi:hypothetical protein Q4562_18950 [Zobellia uliginosa]|nr:hypothetical protein [Zobellia uliginosa]
MKKMILYNLFLLLILACSSEGSTDTPPVDKDPSTEKPSETLLIKNQNPLSVDFVGNGAQWGGYELIENFTGVDDFNEADWNTLKERIDFMRPSFMRIMVSAGWNYTDTDGAFQPEKGNNAFHRIMQYCTDNQITVMFGEWGHSYLNGDRNQVDETWLDNAVNYLDYLIDTKGYSCIKYYNMINEPNGDWSSTNTDYELWQKVASGFQSRLESKGLHQSVKLAGPDIAVFGDAGAVNWITRSKSKFNEKLGLYDIHAYPTKSFVTEGGYLEMLKAYKGAIPEGEQIVLGEIGIKFYGADADLQTENLNRINADPYASDDSNMSVYDGTYAIDISDAMVQSMMAGFSGALVWDVDDAMYNKSGSGSGPDAKKLKRWGFWNILGEEAFGGASDEEIRPFFYPVSLLCRYFPKGADIYEVQLPNKKGLRAIAAKKGDTYTLAIVNSNFVAYDDLSIKAEDNFSFDGVSQYVCTSMPDGSFQAKVDANGFALPLEQDMSIPLDGKHKVNIPARSVIVLTNMP